MLGIQRKGMGEIKMDIQEGEADLKWLILQLINIQS